MIRKIEKYTVDGKEFSCLRYAELQAEENLYNFIRPLIFSGKYNSEACLDRVMESLLTKNERVKLKSLLNDLDYEEE